MNKCPCCGITYGKEVVFCPADGARLEVSKKTIGTVIGQIFDDKYEIKEPIDLGGKWNVYSGVDIHTTQPVAIKIRSDVFEDKYQFARFEKNLEIAKNISYPGFVKIIDYGKTDDSFPYIVTEYVRGKSLKKIIKDIQEISLGLSFSIMEQVLKILEIAHKNNVFHQNIQPSKIMLMKNEDEQFIKILGLGEVSTGEEVDTRIQGAELRPLKNSNNYTAPELFYGSSPSACCDVYSCGVVFYEMFTNVLPFPSGILAYQSQHKSPDPPPMKRVKPTLKIPKKLERSIIKAIQWHAKYRYYTTNSFLKTILATKPGSQTMKLIVTAILAIVLTLVFSDSIRSSVVGFINRLTNDTKVNENLISKEKKTLGFEELKKEYSQSKNDSTKEMKFIPKSEVRVGSDFGEGDEKPARTIDVKAFFIDVAQVSNRDYLRFVQATGYELPAFWSSNNPKKQFLDYPVVGVTWYDAVLYATWSGKRLPTEFEWEKAARIDKNSGKSRIWPWGDSFEQNRCNVQKKKLFSVCRFPTGKTSYGIFDMAGNAWEWTNSWYDVAHKTDRVIRGGSFRSNSYQTRSSYREGFFPKAFRDDIGFRCVKD